MRLVKFVAGLMAALCFAMSASTASADDVLNNEIRLTQAFAKYGLTGNGVAVAILDRGIDYKNNDFRNADGTTRIAYIFDLTDDTGANAAGNTYGMGTIYTRAEINAAIQNNTALGNKDGVGFRDALGHGTATAGICCSNGRNVAKYAGVAPKSTLIIVKIVGAGTAAHDGQPAEPSFFSQARVGVGMTFARDKALELGMPLVMLPNIGSAGAPGDGSSAESKKIDALVGNAKPGAVFVQGSSDDGGQANHAEGTIAQGASDTINFTKEAGTVLFDMWYKDTDRFTISINTPNGAFGPYPGPTTNANNSPFTVVTNSTFTHGHNASVFFTNNKRQVYFQITGPAGAYSVTIQATTVVGNGAWKANLGPSRYWDATLDGNVFTDHIVPGYTINDPASTPNAIVPNAYVYRKSWVDVNGGSHTEAASEGTTGDLWKGSGWGPTWDERIGIDVSAPSHQNFGTLAPNSVYATSPGNKIQDGLGFYTLQNAVSGANPVVTGVIALMLEKNPRLDSTTIKSILQRTARADSFTGAVPNSRWGYGKLNVEGALDDLNAGGAGLIVTSVLPYARSVQTGQVASGFGVMLNAGAAATSCAPALPFGAPAGTFTYQTTNGANQLIGTPNTPANIPGGGAQNFLFTFTPSAAFNGVEIPLVFDCTNTAPASTTNGVNTFILSASATATQDILAIGATPSNDGIVNIPGANGSGVMSVASVNIGGASGTITVTADVGGKALPVNLFVCETNPGTGACLAGPAASVAYTAGLNQTHTFSVFVPATGVVPFDPANNRVFVRFKSGDGVTRGATNAALRTQ